MWTRIRSTDHNDRPDTSVYVMDVDIGVVLLLSKNGIDMPPVFIPGVKIGPRVDRLIAREGYGQIPPDIDTGSYS